jgi:hypothetical protein
MPQWNGVVVAAQGAPNPATAEEVVMANFIAAVWAGPAGFPGAVKIVKHNKTREIKIPVAAGAPVHGIQIEDRLDFMHPIKMNANFCSILLPAVPRGTPAGALAPLPTNVCSVFFAAS